MLEMTAGGVKFEIVALEYRPGDGLIVRSAHDFEDGGELAKELSAALRGSAFRIYRACCDSLPQGDHAEDCAEAPKGKAK